MTKYLVIILFITQVWIFIRFDWEVLGGKLLKSKSAQLDVMNDPVYDALDFLKSAILNRHISSNAD